MNRKFWSRRSLVAMASIILLGFGLALLAFHRYYFGDELTPFILRTDHKSLLIIYGELNTYKPRLIFNGIWSILGFYNLPRMVPMFLNTVFFITIGILLFIISRKRFDANILDASIVAIIALTSRFGAMLYFDYLSGTIETLAFSFFLVSLYICLKSEDTDRISLKELCLLTITCCATVFVHERYIAATFVIGLFVLFKSRVGTPKYFTETSFGIIISIFPILLFFLAGKLCSSLSLATGTAGQRIQIDSSTVGDFLVYFSNVFFGTNFGHPWFVGHLSLKSFPGLVIIPIASTFLALAWIFTLFRLRTTKSNYLKPLLLIALCLSLIAVASLPGSAKQESRWMFPVWTIVSLLVLSLQKGWQRTGFLCLMLVVNLAYVASGSFIGIFNVQASLNASHIGGALSVVSSSFKRGLVIDAPEPETNWVLAGDTILGNSGDSSLTFCRINLNINRNCVSPAPELPKDLRGYDVALQYHRGPDDGSMFYEQIRTDKLIEIAAVNDFPARPFSQPGIQLHLVDISRQPCRTTSQSVSLTVRWKTNVENHPTVNIWLKPANGQPKIFASGAAEGQAVTGAWVLPNMSFVLTDAKTRSVLAVARVEDAVKMECIDSP